LYEIHEVDGILNRETLEAFNALDPYFPPLEERHFISGFWWLVYKSSDPVAFAGLVPFHPVDRYGYLKRCLIKPSDYGRGLQFRLMCVRETKARQIGYTHLVSECLESNVYSANNFRRAGFEQTFPEQPWAKDSLFWIKAL
jgi:GNAT superfamily N-acetyltransferase